MKRGGGNLERVKGIIGHVADRYGLKDMIGRVVIWKKWKDVVGEKVAEMAWPRGFRQRDILVVAVSDSVWMHHLSYMKPVILERLNGLLDKDARLEDIRFVMDDVSAVRRQTAVHEDRERGWNMKNAGSLPEEVIERARELSSHVSDPRLRKAMYGLYLSNAARHIVSDGKS